jgi:hypothetical protein
VLIAITMTLLRNKFFIASPERDRANLWLPRIKTQLIAFGCGPQSTTSNYFFPAAFSPANTQLPQLYTANYAPRATTDVADCRSK